MILSVDVYMLQRLPRTNPTSVINASLAISTASEVAQDRETSMEMPDLQALVTISLDSLPVVIMKQLAGSARPSRHPPITLSTALCLPISSALRTTCPELSHNSTV